MLWYNIGMIYSHFHLIAQPKREAKLDVRNNDKKS